MTNKCVVRCITIPVVAQGGGGGQIFGHQEIDCMAKWWEEERWGWLSSMR